MSTTPTNPPALVRHLTPRKRKRKNTPTLKAHLSLLTNSDVTGNAIRQRIAKIRKNGPAILASTAASTANTPGKKPAGNGAATSPGKKARTPKSSALLGPLLSEDDEEDETTPGAKENKKAGAEGGSGRASKKRSKPEGGEGEGEGDDVALPGTPTKKAKTEEAVEEAGAGTEEADEDVDIRSFFDIDAAGAEDPGDAV